MNRFARAVPLVTIIAAAAGIIPFWFRRIYNHDDFFLAYTAWLRSTPLRPSRDYYVANFTPLAEGLAPLFRIFPESLTPLVIGKALMLATAIALVVLTYLLTRALGTSKAWSALAASLLLWTPDVIKRLSDVRSDPLAACFLLGAAILLLQRKSPLVAGLLAGCAVALTYKLAIALPFLAIGAIAAAPRRRVVAFLLFCTTACVAPAIYYTLRIWLDGLPVVVAIWRDVLGSVGSGGGGIRMQAAQRLLRNPVVPLAVLIGCIGIIKRRQWVYVAGVAGFLVVFIAANPFVFPYNFLIFIPLTVPLAGGLEDLVRGRAQEVLLVVIPVVGMAFGLPAMAEAIYEDNAIQTAFLHWMWSATAPDERAFDWQGIHVGRRGVVHWWNFAGLTQRYQNGWYSLEHELREARASLIIDNYRLGWMTASDKAFVESHYVHFAPCVYTPGFVNSPVIDVFVPGSYRALTSDLAAFTLDGKPLQQVQQLSTGVHTLARRRAQDVALVFTTPLRERTSPPCQRGGLLTGFD